MTVQDVLARLGWADRQGLTVEPIGGGITNLNYRVAVEDQAYVVRIPGQNSEYLGIDRRHEYLCNQAAHEAGVAPAVVAFLEDVGVLVTRFVEGRGLTREEMAHHAMLRRVAATVRRYHDGRSFPGSFTPFQAVRDYLAFCAPRGAPLPPQFPAMLAHADRLEAALDPLGTPRPCHNDLLLANWIDDGHQLWLIDWEYAAMGDSFFDLGNFAVHHQLTDEEERILLEAYLGGAGPRDVARLKLMKIISDLREAMWAMVQVTISNLDYDFVAYGQRHFDRYEAQLQDPRLPMWLEAAGDRVGEDP
jgi:thiamine kinase-like enzyme